MKAPTGVEEALEALRAAGDPARAAGLAARDKADRLYLGTPNPVINDLSAAWRAALTLDERLALARGLWDTDVHEARIAAAKLLTQARMRPDEAVWAVIRGWVPRFDDCSVADHACSAGSRRLMADLSRLDEVEGWTVSESIWTRRAALMMTLPLAKRPFPKEAEREARERVLGWLAGCVPERNRFIQQAVALWLRDLSKHDPDRVRAYLALHGGEMTASVRREAERLL